MTSLHTPDYEQLRVSDLHAFYGESHILHGIDLLVRRGELVTLLGRNGSGRSTLARALMGLLPGKGRIEFEGQAIEELTLEERVMLGIALVALLQGCATVANPDPRDPLESINRTVFGFNDAVDRAVLKPVATAYVNTVPALGRTGIKNFFYFIRISIIA